MNFSNYSILRALFIAVFGYWLNCVQGAWTNFILPCSYDKNNTLQMLFHREGQGHLRGIALPEESSRDALTPEEGARILQEIGFYSFEWTTDSMGVLVDEENEVTIFYMLTQNKDLGEKYIWMSVDDVFKKNVNPLNFFKSLYASTWSNNRNALQVIQNNLPQDALVKRDWRVFLMPCYKNKAGDVFCLFENNKAISVDTKSLAEEDFWQSSTSNIDRLVSKKLDLLFGENRGDGRIWNFADQDVYRMSSLGVIIYFPSVRAKDFADTFSWKKLDEMADKVAIGDKNELVLKSVGWETGQSLTEPLFEIIKRRLQPVFWLTTIRVALNAGVWAIYLPVRDGKYNNAPMSRLVQTRDALPNELLYVTSEGSDLEGVAFVYDDSVKKETGYKVIPAKSFLPKDYGADFMDQWMSALIAKHLPTVIKNGIIYNENRLIKNLAEVLFKLLPA